MTIFIGVDEAGRGPLFGRVYTCAVILPDEEVFDTKEIKDSKKFTSFKKIKKVHDDIINNCISYSYTYCSEKTIDEQNILQATINSMHQSIKNVIDQVMNDNILLTNIKILVDGNRFKPFYYNYNNKSYLIEHECVIKGDSIYKCIGAASIIAKVSRDLYINDICEECNELDEKYDLLKNKGYGTKKHIEGIEKYGYSEFHRMTFKLKKHVKKQKTEKSGLHESLKIFLTTTH